MKKIRVLPAIFVSLACLSLVSPARAAGFDITSNSTSAQSISSGTGTVESGKSLTVSGSTVAVTTKGSSTIINNGTISQTGTGRGIRDNTGGDTIVITNNSGASIVTADADAIQMNVANTVVTLNNSGTITSNNASLGGAQAVDFNAVTSANIINNYAGGVLKAYAADAVRPGVNGVVNNYGTIISIEKNGSTSSDGIDAQTNSGIQVTNYTGGLIEGGRHGITGGNTSGDGTYAMTITNQAGATIQGDDGSGVNIDGINGNEVVTITNAGTITGNGVTADGDGVDVDGLVNLHNTGVIRSLNANADTSEGVTVGGGTIVNSGTIEGSVAAGNTTDATGVGITIGGIDSVTPTEPMYGPTTIDNQAGGLIRGDTDSAIRVVGGASGYTLTITNEAGATIEGGGATAAAIQTGDDNDTVINSGTIEADSSGLAVDLGGGTNAMEILGGSAQVLGDIAIHTGSLTIDPGAGNSFTYNYSIRSASSVQVNSGTVNLNGASTYTGSTTVAGGTLLVHNTTGSATGSGSVIVQSGAAFGGNGRVAFTGTNHLTVQSGGAFLAQGLVIDVSNLTAGSTAVEFQAGATPTFTLSAETPALTITGGVANTVAFNGNTFEFAGSAVNGTYILIAGNNTTFSGITTDANGNVTNGATIDSTFASQHQGSYLKEQGNNLEVVVTPEPGTWALFAVGAGVLALAFHRRLQAA
jgi:autotransporter-associated beta strand protein